MTPPSRSVKPTGRDGDRTGAPALFGGLDQRAVAAGRTIGRVSVHRSKLRSMIDHVGIPAKDPAAAAAFYTTVFAPLGMHEAMRIDTPGGPVVGLADASGQPFLWFSPAGSAAGTAGPGGWEAHISLHARSRAEIDAVAEAARQAGAEILHEPREWPEYHPGYYAVFVRDPEGHNAEAVTHGEAPPIPA